MPFIGTQPRAGAYSVLDSITVSATDTFNLTLDGSAYYPQSPNHLLVSINGSIQAPVNSFTINGSQIIFSENLLATDVIDFILALGDVLSIGTPSANAVTTSSIQDGAVTNAKIDSMAATKLTGALPAIDGSSLTGIDALPTQTGNNGYYLTTDGSTASWAELSVGASAGGVIWENSTVISSNYTLATGKNGLTVGPVTVNAGVSVTVPSGQRWVVL